MSEKKPSEGAQSISEGLQKIEESIKDLEKLKQTAEQQDEKITDKVFHSSMQEIQKDADNLLDELQAKRKSLVESQQKMETLDQSMHVLETDYASLTQEEIENIQQQHDTIMSELEHQRNTIKKTLSLIEKLELMITVLTYKMYEHQRDYRKRMEELQAQKQQLMMRDDIEEKQRNLAIEEVDKKMADSENKLEEALAAMESQKQELKNKSLGKIQYMDNTLESLKHQKDDVITQLEHQKKKADPLTVEKIDTQIADIIAKFEEDVKALAHLQLLGWHEMNPEEALAVALEQKGLKITKSGKIMTSSGQVFTLEEAEQQGFFDDIELSWENLLGGFQVLQNKEEDDILQPPSETTSASSIYSKMTSEDVHYLQETLGKPLTLALAEITKIQPKDPIHYLGHWLFKYRYNQEIDELQKEEIQELNMKRQQVARERWQKMLEEEARAAVLDAVTRAEEIAWQNELKRMMERNEEIEEENYFYDAPM